MTIVGKFFDIDINECMERSESNDYFTKFLSFYTQVENKNVSEISKKQFQWLQSVERKLKEGDV